MSAAVITSLAASGLAPLLVAADLAASFGQLAPLSRGSVVIGAMLGDCLVAPARRISGGGIAAIGIMMGRIPWVGLLASAGEDDDYSERAVLWRRRLAWLAALVAGGNAVAELARRVDRWSSLVDQVCSARRKSSRLRSAADLVAGHSSLTASRLAGIMAVSRQGATLLLEEARKAGVVREVTHGNAFRRYVAAI